MSLYNSMYEDSTEGVTGLSWRLCKPREVPEVASYKDKAIARFNLRSPFPEEHDETVWKAYYEERSKLEEHQDPGYKIPGSERFPIDQVFTDPFREIIREQPVRILRDDDKNGTRRDEVDALSDGIIYLSRNSEEQEEDTSRVSVDLFARIYPTHTLTAIEAALTHHYQMHMSYNEYLCVLAYRLRRPTPKPLGMPTMNRGVSGRMYGPRFHETTFTGKDWHTIFWGEAEDPKGRYGDQNWPAGMLLDEEDVHLIAQTLLGARGDRRTEEEHRVLAMRVLLAALTIEVDLTRGAPDEKRWGTENSFGRFLWLFSATNGWFEAKLRVLCGVGSETDKARQLEVEEYPGEPDNYDDDDDDDDDD